MFKYYYAEQNPEKFDLFKKADSSEFLQNILELNHYCLNTNPNKKNVDQSCKNGKDMCHIHKTINMKVFSLGACKCDSSQVKR